MCVSLFSLWGFVSFGDFCLVGWFFLVFGVFFFGLLVGFLVCFLEVWDFLKLICFTPTLEISTSLY